MIDMNELSPVMCRISKGELYASATYIAGADKIQVWMVLLDATVTNTKFTVTVIERPEGPEYLMGELSRNPWQAKMPRRDELIRAIEVVKEAFAAMGLKAQVGLGL